MTTKCDQCGEVSPADIHTCGATKSDPYASEAETRALLVPDTRTEAEKHLDHLIQAASVSELCGADYSQALRNVALKLVEAVIFVTPCCGKYETCTQDCLPRRDFIAAKQQNSETVTQTFEGLPLRKLKTLLTSGWTVNGVSIERTEEDGTTRRGAVTTGGMVLWWHETEGQAVPETSFGDMAAPVRPTKDVEISNMGKPFTVKAYTTQPAAPCTWTQSPDPSTPGTFDATCGVAWTFTDGGPVENGMRFCPGCGADVSVAALEPEEDLYDLAVKADNGGQS